jgi:molybdenum-dependent DNA-binding transcriptional regulator ModE
MDLNVYYKNMREEEEKIDEPYPVVVSHETGDGGRKGQATEVTKRLAAKMIVEGLARLANEEERSAFRALQAKAVEFGKKVAAAENYQLRLMALSELEKLQQTAPPEE